MDQFSLVGLRVTVWWVRHFDVRVRGANEVTCQRELSSNVTD